MNSEDYEVHLDTVFSPYGDIYKNHVFVCVREKQTMKSASVIVDTSRWRDWNTEMRSLVAFLRDRIQVEG